MTRAAAACAAAQGDCENGPGDGRGVARSRGRRQSPRQGRRRTTPRSAAVTRPPARPTPTTTRPRSLDDSAQESVERPAPRGRRGRRARPGTSGGHAEQHTDEREPERRARQRGESERPPGERVVVEGVLDLRARVHGEHVEGEGARARLPAPRAPARRARPARPVCHGGPRVVASAVERSVRSATTKSSRVPGEPLGHGGDLDVHLLAGDPQRELSAWGCRGRHVGRGDHEHRLFVGRLGRSNRVAACSVSVPVSLYAEVVGNRFDAVDANQLA